MSEFQLGVIGAGNMATAMLRGVVERGYLSREEIVASDPDASRRAALEGALGIACVPDNLAPASCARVLLCVKPFVMDEALADIAGAVRDDALVISIAAGISTDQLDRGLGGKGRIVRVMPNTPMLVGAGVSAVSAGPRATPDDVEWTRALCAAGGQAVVVEEGLMDAVTGVSGSGPAYFLYFIEALTEAGIEQGLDPEVAAVLAAHTGLGAAKLLVETGETPQALRAKVTTPGGTTEAAIRHMEQSKLSGIIQGAVAAATQRGKELGG